MNPMTNVKNIQKLNERMLEMGVADDVSWHKQYKDSAYVFIGGLPYDLTEGDILCVFSQYGEIVNINLVRDKKTGKQKGFCFLCYEDQRSTILAVDNFNGIKLGGRTIRVDHCADYRRPKGDEKDDDGKRKEIIEEGCAPKTPSPSPSEDEEESSKPIKKKKDKKKKRHKESKHKKQEYSSESESEDNQKSKKHKDKDTKAKTRTDRYTDKAHGNTKDNHQKLSDKGDSTSSKIREWDYGKRNLDQTRSTSPSKRRKTEWERDERRERDERHSYSREERKHTSSYNRDHWNRDKIQDRHDKYYDSKRDRNDSDYRDKERSNKREKRK